MKRSVLVSLLFVAPFAQAGINDGFFFQSVPTLDEVGLGLLIALVAGVAGWAVRRKSRK